MCVIGAGGGTDADTAVGWADGAVPVTAGGGMVVAFAVGRHCDASRLFSTRMTNAPGPLLRRRGQQ